MPTQTLPTPQGSGAVVVDSVVVPSRAPTVNRVPPPHFHGPIEPAKFSFREARQILGDLFVHRPAIYWADMVVTLAIGYGFAALYLNAPVAWPLKLVSFFISGFALFRA